MDTLLSVKPTWICIEEAEALRGRPVALPGRSNRRLLVYHGTPGAALYVVLDDAEPHFLTPHALDQLRTQRDARSAALAPLAPPVSAP